MTTSSHEKDLKYTWDYETIHEQIPGLAEYQETDVRLKRLCRKLTASIIKLLKELKKEININFGKKANVLAQRSEDLKKVSMDKLIEYYDLIGKSLIDMVRKGKLNKMEILDLNSQHAEDIKCKNNLVRLVNEERDQFQAIIDNKEAKYQKSRKELDEKNRHIGELLSENANLKVMAKTEAVKEKRRLQTMSSFRISKSIPYNEFNSLRKILAEDKFALDNVTQKEKKIHHLSVIRMKKDQKIAKETMENSILKIQVEKKAKEINRMQSALNSTQEELIKIKNIMAMKEKRKLQREALSENNPHFVDYYKKKLMQKDKETIRLKKRLRTYMLQEKRVKVKEKAFEFERAENFRNVIILQNELKKERLKYQMAIKK